MTNKKIAQILLPLAFDEEFSYYFEDNLNLELGDVILVNFVNRNIYGVVTGFKDKVENPKFKIKKVISKDKNIKINPKLLDLINFASSYNVGPRGLFLKLAISILNSTKTKEVEEITYQISSKIPKNLKITAKRQEIIDIIKSKGEISSKELNETIKISASTIKTLVDKEVLIKKSKKIEKEAINFPKININNFKLKELSKEQLEAAHFLNDKVAENNHNVTLIDGVTGSGKTEIYFAAIAKILKEKSGQILILLPEIILVDQLLKRFESQFHFKPEVWHSKVNNNKKRRILYAINNGNVRVLIGTRSSLFLPFSDLKLIIVDEEHESSFKQEDIVNYHGRDMAILRSKIENISAILSSATPSIETFVNAQSQKYHHLEIKSKFFRSDNADIELVDMKKENLQKNQYISNILAEEIRNCLENGKQGLLFLNRRGYAPITLCKSCGFKINCINCSSYVTYHQKSNKLVCHHCGYTSAMKTKCSNCDAENSFITIGAGVEKIAEEVGNLFKNARIAIMTSDTIHDPQKAKEFINKINNDEIDLIIGTQIIAKGHHFPNLSLVGIIDGDGSFNSANLKASEKSYQLLTQVIGRAGREKHKAKVLLQSYNKDNLVFKYIINQNRNEFLDLEIQNRKILEMPPFGKMVAIIFISKDENLAIHSAKNILKQFPIQSNIEIFGPAPMPVSKIRKNYYYRILVKSDKKLNIQKLIKNIVTNFKKSNKVRIKIDVDPI